jgi:MFS family permease
MAAGIGAPMVVRSFPVVLAAIGVLALGTALVVPNLSSLVATTSGGRFATALGLKSSASSLGQFLGPLVGGSMLAWREASPYALAAVTLLVLGDLTARRPHL